MAFEVSSVHQHRGLAADFGDAVEFPCHPQAGERGVDHQAKAFLRKPGLRSGEAGNMPMRSPPHAADRVSVGKKQGTAVFLTSSCGFASIVRG